MRSVASYAANEIRGRSDGARKRHGVLAVELNVSPRLAGLICFRSLKSNIALAHAVWYARCLDAGALLGTQSSSRAAEFILVVAASDAAGGRTVSDPLGCWESAVHCLEQRSCTRCFTSIAEGSTRPGQDGNTKY